MKKFVVAFLSLVVGIFTLAGCSDQGSKNVPELHIRGSTSCPHCLQSIPVFEKQVYSEYKEQMNISLHTLSETAFDTVIPQETGSQMEFEKYTNQSCDYIPSWLILDNSGIVV